MEWFVASDSTLSKYFCGENVWKKKWVRDDCGQACVEIDGVDFRMTVWRATFSGKEKIFAAGEISNENWVFAIPR